MIIISMNSEIWKDNPCSIPVLQYDMYDNLIKEWYSIADATRFYGLTHITDCCKGKRNHTGGFKWKCKEELKCQ